MRKENIVHITPARALSERLAESYFRLGDPERAKKQEACFKCLVSVECRCKRVNELVPLFTCGSRLCPICGHRRGLGETNRIARGLSLYQEHGGNLPNQSMLLTISPSYAGQKDLKQQLTKIRNMGKVQQQCALLREHGLGSYSKIEVCPGRNGYPFPHLHSLVTLDTLITEGKARETERVLAKIWLENFTASRVDARLITLHDNAHDSGLSLLTGSIRYLNKYAWFNPAEEYQQYMIDDLLSAYIQARGVPLTERRGMFRGLDKLVAQEAQLVTEEVQEYVKAEQVRHGDISGFVCTGCQSKLKTAVHRWNGDDYATKEEI